MHATEAQTDDATRAVFRIHINGTMEAVWHEITRTDAAQKCMFDMQLHTPGLEPGAPMQMRSVDGKYTGVVGEVIDYDPPRLYSHTFRFTQFDDPPCIVRYELEEAEQGGVNFTLTLEDLPVGTKTAKQMVRGGTMIVNTLKNMVERGKPSFGVRMLYVMFKCMAFMTPKKCRAENWPLERTA